MIVWKVDLILVNLGLFLAVLLSELNGGFLVWYCGDFFLWFVYDCVLCVGWCAAVAVILCCRFVYVGDWFVFFVVVDGRDYLCW